MRVAPEGQQIYLRDSNLTEEERQNLTDQGQNTEGYNPGLFDFQKMMNDFYGYDPKDEDGNIDKEAAMVKNALQANFLQSAIDGQIAAGLAQQNSAIAMDNMSHQANLELANTADLMQREFAFNQLAQESTFGYENDFANAQYDRDIGMLAATGEQNRLNMQEQGQQDRLGEIVAGEQDRLTAALNNASQEAIAEGRYAADTYAADASAQASMYGADASRDAATEVARTQAQSALDVSRDQTASQERITDTQTQSAETIADTQKESALGVADRQLEGTTFTAAAQQAADMYGSDKSLQATQYSADASKDIAKTEKEAATTVATTQADASRDVATTQAEADIRGAELAAQASMYGSDRSLEGTKDTNITSTRNIGETGKQTRETMGLENRLKAKDRADMHRYARSTARAM